MRIFIDCTDTYHNTLNTGIQRVVRNLVNHSEIAGGELGLECIPVILESGGYVRISNLRYGTKKRAAFRLRAYLNNYYLKMVRGIAKRLPFSPLQHFFTASKHEFGLTQLILVTASPLRWIWRLKLQTPIKRENVTSNFINPELGDMLLLADAFWNYDFQSTASKVRQSGAKIVAIIYDIIPISHPEMAEPQTCLKFETHLAELSSYTDGFLCISDYTKHTLLDYFQTQSYVKNLESKCFDFFHLGAELDAINPNGHVRDKIKIPFLNNELVYLTVGTLEPRKNHAYLLKVFDLLWQENSLAVLVIVGRVGWLCDETLDAIRSHRMCGTRLFFIDDASDVELDYCYSHSKALLFPAIVEGFGLPLIEAQQKGLPVFASDIPVFHEVAGSSAAYFDHTDPQSLAKMLMEYERTNEFPADGPLNFTWLNWQESTLQMLTKLLRMAHEIKTN